MASYQTCFEVSDRCPVVATTYGYTPTLWANVALCILFALCGALQIILGVYYRTWTWALTVSFGCLIEFAGYLGRIYMHYNPWNGDAYQDQIITIVIAPSFIAAGVNLTLKYIVLTLDPKMSRIRPSLYTWIFVTIDFGCIALQAVGGGMAASAGNEGDEDLLSAGNNIIVTGIALQVANLVIFGSVACEYALRLYRHRAELGTKLDYAKDTKFRAFLAAITVAFFGVLIRSIYRIPEMAGGWGGKAQRNELQFMVLDGLMVCLAAIAVTIVHPGWSFPALSGPIRTRRSRKSEREQAG